MISTTTVLFFVVVVAVVVFDRFDIGDVMVAVSAVIVGVSGSDFVAAVLIVVAAGVVMFFRYEVTAEPQSSVYFS